MCQFSNSLQQMVVTGILALILASNAYGLEFYIATNGDNANPGTKDAPFAGLEHARDHIRTLKDETGALPETVTVYLREGRYNRQAAFELTAEDSGDKDARIVYRAYPGETAVLTGGKVIPSSAFTPVTDESILARIIDKQAHAHVRQIDLGKLGIDDLGELRQAGFPRVTVSAPLELVFNGEFMTLARWPNEETLRLGEIIEPGSAPRYDTVSDKKPCFTYDHDRADKWAQAEDIWLYGIFNRTWAPDFIQVDRIDTEKKQILLAQDHHYGLKKYKPEWKWDWYYVLNLLEEIDMPGEYYLNYATGILYLWPPTALDKADVQVTMMTAPFMIDMKEVSYVTFRGLTLENSREGGIKITSGSKNRIENCTVRNMGGMAIDIDGMELIMGNSPQLGWDGGGRNHVVTDCEIYGMGTLGIRLGGGDRKTLQPGSNAALNNHIHHCGRRIETYTPAVRVTGVGNHVAHNEIHDMPQFGMGFFGNEHRIEFNDIHHVCRDYSDCGAIYTAANPSNRGTIIRHNYIHHIGQDQHMVGGVYLDYTCCATEVVGNVFYKVWSIGGLGATVINGGNDNIIRNNMFIDCRTVLYDSNFLNGWGKDQYDSYYKIWKTGLAEVNYQQPPYSERYPKLVGFFEEDHLKHDRNRFDNNLIYACKDVYIVKYDSIVPRSNNYETDEDPGFVDAANMDFRLKADSIVYEKIPGFAPIPFENIGIREKVNGQ